MLFSKVYKKNPDFVSRLIADEMVLVPVKRTAVDLDRFFVLNDSAGIIWQLIDGKRNLAEIKTHLINDFDIDEPTLATDMNKFIKELSKIEGIIQINS